MDLLSPPRRNRRRRPRAAPGAGWYRNAQRPRRVEPVSGARRRRCSRRERAAPSEGCRGDVCLTRGQRLLWIPRLSGGALPPRACLASPYLFKRHAHDGALDLGVLARALLGHGVHERLLVQAAPALWRGEGLSKRRVSSRCVLNHGDVSPRFRRACCWFSTSVPSRNPMDSKEVALAPLGGGRRRVPGST